MNWTARGEQRLELVAEALSSAPQTARQVAEGVRRRGLAIRAGVVFMLRQLVQRGVALRLDGEPVQWVRKP